MWEYNYSTPAQDELCHFGVPGMKWGKRKNNYRSTGVRSAIARRNNEKVDKSFNNWKENSQKKNNAIELGYKANVAKREHYNDKTNKELKDSYKSANKEYKKALRSNTTYRKGQIKQVVGQDASRKYLSDAKKVKKQLDMNPGDKQLKKQYDKLMSKHDVERARARRAPEVAAKRSAKKASIKRTMTMTVKAAAASAAIGAGTYAANRYLSKHDYTLNGKPIRVNSKKVNGFARAVKAGKELFDYI